MGASAIAPIPYKRQYKMPVTNVLSFPNREPPFSPHPHLTTYNIQRTLGHQLLGIKGLHWVRLLGQQLPHKFLASSMHHT